VVEHLLCMLGTDSIRLPSSICGLLAQRNIAASSIHMTKPSGSDHWWVQLVVSVDSTAEAELVVKRLDRLVDVVNVWLCANRPGLIALDLDSGRLAVPCARR
jgi:acetolactate synthase regulatory subunit